MTPPYRPGLLKRIWAQVANIIMCILLAAAIVAGILRDWPEFGLIVGVVVINITIGVLQEGKAEKAAEAIRNMLSPNATVLRDGKRVTIDASLLVPGDIIFIASGDRLPADVRMLTSFSLQALEAMLTGESVPVNKDTDVCEADAGLAERHCIAFSGTMVVYGQGTGVVVATGDNAEIGKIASMVGGVRAGRTPLLHQLDRFGATLSVLTIIVAIITLLIAHFARKHEVGESFEIAVGVAVAIIPEGLPSVVTITLALGVQHMAKKKAIVRQLPAVETLGAVTVICTDKTGTLTKNEMTAVGLRTSAAAYRISGNGYTPEGDIKLNDETLSSEHRERMRRLLAACILCNDSSIVARDANGNIVQSRICKAMPFEGLDIEADRATSSASNIEVTARRTTSLSGFSTSAVRSGVTWTLTGDPTEGALLVAAMKSGMYNVDAITQRFPRISVVPFESDYKFMATMHDIPRADGSRARVVFVKGAPDRIIPKCATNAVNDDVFQSEPIDHDVWLDRAQSLSAEGLRVIAIAHFEVAADKQHITVHDVLTAVPHMQLNALVAIVDPPRDECVEAIAECHSAGVSVKMITGDHADTARTIGGWLGIPNEVVLTGPEMEVMSDAELFSKVQGCCIYARASPEHKLRIVRALQGHGHIAAMTGDGTLCGRLQPCAHATTRRSQNACVHPHICLAYTSWKPGLQV
ncbi:HAD family hydrolase [archaeon]|nr:MAG: HAD family hydrolase [archaeon]